MQASPATTVVVYRGGETLAKVGVMGESPVVQEGTILQKSLREGKYGRELYLPALQVFPPYLIYAGGGRCGKFGLARCGRSMLGLQ